jgi:hypothetical protein
VLVVGVLVFLVYPAVAVRDRGPQLRAEALGVESGQAGSEEHVVRNGRTVETVSSTIAYVPVESRRAGALVFAEDPRSGTLTIRAVAYNRP